VARFRVDVEPALLDWAIERSRIDLDELYSKKALRDLPLWQRREKKPTYNELQTFARATHTPFGMLFLIPVRKILTKSALQFRLLAIPASESAAGARQRRSRSARTVR
jgi:hypothetical protein